MKQSLAADFGLLWITFIWGTTFIIVQNTLDQLTPMTFNAWRFLTAALFLVLWHTLVNRGKKRARRFSLRLVFSGIILGLFLFIGYACQTIGLLYTTASNAAFITGLSVVLVPILSALFLKKAPPLAALSGALIAAIGLYFLTTKGGLAVNTGDLIVLACAAAFALHIVFTEKFTDQFDSLSLTITQLATVACLSFFIGRFTDHAQITDWQKLAQPEIIGVILFMGIFATALAFLLQTVLQKKTPATHVGIIYIMEPVFAAWTSVVFQNARFGLSEIVGSFLILFGMLFTEVRFGKNNFNPDPK